MLAKKHRGGFSMAVNRKNILAGMLKGLFVAIALTSLGMLIIAALTVFIRISDGLLTALNQILKIASIALGVWAAVGRGGSRGFVTGAALGLIYMVAGYAFFAALGGPYSTTDMLGEMLLGSAIGGVCGAVLANLSPRRSRK